MTQEEKAKAYDKALERARKLYERGTITESLGYVFPELKESEDERIRKAIHIYLDWLDGRNKDYQPKGDYSIKDMIAWLEKQGEYANFRNKIQVGDKVTRNRDGVLVNLSQLKRVAKPSEEQSEKKPTKWTEEDAMLAEFEKQGEPTDINPSEFDLRLNKLLKQFETLPKEELASSLSFYLNVVQNDGTYKDEEKQGKQKVSYTTIVKTGDGGINAMVTRYIEIPFGAKDSELQETTYFIPKGYYAKVEGDKVVIKKGEQDPVNKVEQKFKVGDSIKTTNEEPLTITKIDDKGYWSEDLLVCDFDDAAKWELVEQKPADNIEPKFKVGDWITNGDYIWKIVEVKPLDYVLQSQDGAENIFLLLSLKNLPSISLNLD